MIKFQKIIGIIIVLVSVFIGLSLLDFTILVFGVFAGCLLISVAKIVENVQEINFRTLGISLTAQQIRKIQKHTSKVLVLSNSLKIYKKDSAYSILRLDDEYYVRARAIHNYLIQDGSKYTIEFPNCVRIETSCASSYRPGISMFKLDEQVFIKLSFLQSNGIKVEMTEAGLVIDV